MFMQRGAGDRAAAFKISEEIICIFDKWYDLKASLLEAKYNLHS